MSDEGELNKLRALLAPRKLPWQSFEDEVAEHVETEIRFCNLGLKPDSAKVIKKPRYYSKLRESNIVFDVSIEVWPFENGTRPTLIWIWECKNYPDRNVSVDEVEEFHDKLKQVGAHKGTIASRLGFAKGAITLAKSYGIALLTLTKQEVTHFAFSQDSGIIRKVELEAVNSYNELGDLITSEPLDGIIRDEFGRTGLMKW